MFWAKESPQNKESILLENLIIKQPIYAILSIILKFFVMISFRLKKEYPYLKDKNTN